ncbi:LOW QUALITY PROTEIN: atypical chemokine receptor 2 [Ara ararauna]
MLSFFRYELWDRHVNVSASMVKRGEDAAKGEKASWWAGRDPEMETLEMQSGTAWNGYLNNFRHGTTTGIHLSSATTTTAALLDAANLSDSLYEYYEEDYKQYALKKEEVLSFSRVFLPSFYTVVFLVGLAENALLFIVLIMYIKKKKKLTEVYLLNLGISDFLLLALPFWALYISQWVTDTLCPVLNAMYTVNLSDIFFMSCMSLDMYLQIVHACFPNSFMMWKKSVLILLVGWVLSILFSIPDGLFTSTMEIHNKTIVCAHDYGQNHLFWKVVFRVMQNTLGFLFPFLFMMFCYSRVACVLTMSQMPGKRALCIVLTLMGVFFVLWFTYNIVLILHSLQDVGMIRSCEQDYAMQITESLSFVHCCLNPFLYTFVKKRFRSYWKIPQAIFQRSAFFDIIQPSETSQSCSRYTAEIEMLSITNV